MAAAAVAEEAAQASRRRRELSPEEARIRAMSHPDRATILRYIVEKGDKAAVDINHELGIDMSKCSYHCRKLIEFGCVEIVREEQIRGSVKHYLRATERHLVDTPEWEKLHDVDREGVLARGMQPLIDDFTGAVKSGHLLQRSGDFHITRIPLKGVDAEGYAELMAAHRALYDETYEIEKRAAVRMAETGETPVTVSSGQTLFRTEGF